MLVKPILHLSRITKEFGRGNLTLEIDIKTKDEVGELTQSFKEMSRNLQSSNEQIRYLAYHDNLTGLPNRLMFNDCLEHSLARARRSEMPLALLYIDLDNFKYINDTLGHHAGDELLKLTARRMRSSLRRGDHLARTELEQDPQTVARVGGDEFAIILPCIKSPYAAASVATRLLESLSQPFRIVSQEIFVTASIGITTYPQDADNAEALVKNADVAMYHAKEQGKNIYQYYSESMNAAALERLTMENRLRRALERDELLLHYQPLVDAQTQKIVGVEALIRWHQPELGWIFPTEFIPLAEESGLIVPIGEWVMKTACKQLKQWLDSGIGRMRLSVNLSNQQFRRERLDSVIENILRETGLPPSYLEVELTESSIMRSEQTAEKVLTAIKRLGVSIALDDFGTGYSSLGYLRRFPIDTLKIDRSFVKDIVTDKDGAEILSAIIAMAQTLKLSVTAEGVEDIQQFEFLRSKGCDTIQGYLFSRPVPPEDIEMLLQQPVMLAS
jgi:diguanylate cyclase (GGDEF)-like protein